MRFFLITMLAAIPQSQSAPLFVESQITAPSAHLLPDARSGDINRDGLTDIAAVGGSSNFFSVYLNDGNGRFPLECKTLLTSESDQIEIEDLDSDQLPEILVTQRGGPSSLVIFWNTGTQTANCPVFIREAYPTMPAPIAIGISDLNSDGRKDFVLAGDSHQVWMHFNLGPGTLTRLNLTSPQLVKDQVAFTKNIMLRDLDGDQMPEIIFTSGSLTSGLYVVWNDTLPLSITWTGAPIRLTNGPVFGFDGGDFNNDLIEDLAVAVAGYSIVVFEGVGFRNFNFRPSDVPTTGGVRARDFNHDGLTDLAVANPAQSEVILVKNTLATGDFMAIDGVGYPVAHGLPALLRPADLDGDSDDDLIVMTAQTPGLSAGLTFLENQTKRSHSQPSFAVIQRGMPKQINLSQIQALDSETFDLTLKLLGGAPLGAMDFSFQKTATFSGSSTLALQVNNPNLAVMNLAIYALNPQTLTYQMVGVGSVSPGSQLFQMTFPSSTLVDPFLKMRLRVILQSTQPGLGQILELNEVRLWD